MAKGDGRGGKDGKSLVADDGRKLKKVVALKPGYAKLHPDDETEQRIAEGTVFVVPADAESKGVRGGRGTAAGPWFEDVEKKSAAAGSDE